MFMVRSFSTVKGFRSRPSRSCRNSAGPREVSRTRSHSRSSNGAMRMISASDTTRSITRFDVSCASRRGVVLPVSATLVTAGPVHVVADGHYLERVAERLAYAIDLTVGHVRKQRQREQFGGGLLVNRQRTVRKPPERRLQVTRHGVVHTGLDATVCQFRAYVVTPGDAHGVQVIDVACQRGDTCHLDVGAGEQIRVPTGQLNPALRP